MKRFFKYILIAVMVPILFTSCLKDDELIGPDADGAVENIIEFGNIAAPSSDKFSEVPMFVTSVEMVPSFELNVPIKIVGVYNPKSDVKVVVEVDNSLITKYNSTEETSFVPLDPSKYTVSTYEVTIPKGDRSANFNVKLLGDKFDFEKDYALAFRIKSVSEGTISGNFGHVVIATVPKNNYDGIYSSEDGFIQRYSAPGTPTTGDNLNGTLKGNRDVTLSSVNGSTVSLTGLNWGNNAGGVGGVDYIQLMVDPATNLVTVSSTSNGTLKNTPGKVNKYDPATKTFTLNFDWNPATTPRVVTNMVIKYKGPR
ncbi:DUF1735 domain-containing protein [Sphingobacterium daejeonense]|uniref:DUF1735 domain-containing protein n=1 Tax=Sphingobacterium daejeonense TaxID=371142 RepID=UPI0010C40805|nr:DUF1735 domain-containing protein [Sphingobacterium daejeonense]MCT1530785.1 DUF1735 domain-containing protein [Sphingobacterium daejeonense]VTQ06126.1 Domain of uncharacterised function (DUF1735) [Sphingobacterium daejeonense]